MPPNRSQAPARGGAGLCGWFGSIDPKGPPAAALARMGQALDGNADPAMSAITEGVSRRGSPYNRVNLTKNPLSSGDRRLALSPGLRRLAQGLAAPQEGLEHHERPNRR